MERGGGADSEWPRRLCSLRSAFALRPGMRLREAMSDQRHPYLLIARNRTARSSVVQGAPILRQRSSETDSPIYAHPEEPKMTSERPRHARNPPPFLWKKMPRVDIKERTQERKKRSIHTHNIHMGRGRGGHVVLSFRDSVSRGKPPPRYDDPLTPRHMSGKMGMNGSDGIRRLARSLAHRPGYGVSSGGSRCRHAEHAGERESMCDVLAFVP